MEIIPFQLMCTEMIADRSLEPRSTARKTASTCNPTKLNIYGILRPTIWLKCGHRPDGKFYNQGGTVSKTPMYGCQNGSEKGFTRI
jgi:hypothetical protein